VRGIVSLPWNRLLACTGLALLLGAGCAVSRGGLAPALEPYLAAGRFVPSGMQSFTCERNAPIFVQEVAVPIFVSAGRAFEPPGDVGFGPSRTIWIADHGRAAAAARDRCLHERRVETVRVADRDCLHVTAVAREGDIWCATIDDRFVLWATHPDLLAEALARTGDLEQALAPFGDLSFVPVDATRVMFLLPRGRAPRWALASPTRPTMFALRSVPGLVTMFTRGQADAACQYWLESVCEHVDEPAQAGHGWSGRSGTLAREESAWGFQLSWLWLFGFCIFI
jgi:hypothetical protein